MSASVRDIVNPATEQVVITVELTSPEQIDALAAFTDVKNVILAAD